MVGDFNTVLGNKLNSKGSHNKNYYPKAHGAIENVMASIDLIDIWMMNKPQRGEIHLAKIKPGT